MFRRYKYLLASIYILSLAAVLPAQDEDEILVGGRPIENVIVDRDMYVRLVAETRFSEDDRLLLSEDPNYQRFPSKIYDTQISFNSISKFRITSAYSFWENDQGLDVKRNSVSLRIPLNNGWSLYPKYLLQKEEGTSRDYYYMSAGGWIKKLYTFTQLMRKVDEKEETSYQIYEYMTWQPGGGSFRLGLDGSLNTETDSNDLSYWHGKVFAVLPLFSERTSLHISWMHLDYDELLEYDTYEAYLYRLIGETSSVRLSYRYYEDSSDLYSHAYGIKAKHYFSPRLGIHLGYRMYDHSEGADLDTLFGGFNLLM